MNAKEFNKVLCCGVIMFWVTCSYAQPIVNPSFEDGLNGWQSFGAGMLSSAAEPVTWHQPSAGSAFAYQFAQNSARDGGLYQIVAWSHPHAVLTADVSTFAPSSYATRETKVRLGIDPTGTATTPQHDAIQWSGYFNTPLGDNSRQLLRLIVTEINSAHIGVWLQNEHVAAGDYCCLPSEWWNLTSWDNIQLRSDIPPPNASVINGDFELGNLRGWDTWGWVDAPSTWFEPMMDEIFTAPITGDYSQINHGAGSRTKNGGIFQRVRVPQASEVRAQIRIVTDNSWVTEGGQADTRTNLRFGIDPYGGFSPEAPSIVWSEYQNSYRESLGFFGPPVPIILDTKAEMDAITLFIEHQQPDQAYRSTSAVDNVVLVVYTPVATYTRTPTAAIPLTPVPTATSPPPTPADNQTILWVDMRRNQTGIQGEVNAVPGGMVYGRVVGRSYNPKMADLYSYQITKALNPSYNGGGQANFPNTTANQAVAGELVGGFPVQIKDFAAAPFRLGFTMFHLTPSGQGLTEHHQTTLYEFDLQLSHQAIGPINVNIMPEAGNNLTIRDPITSMGGEVVLLSDPEVVLHSGVINIVEPTPTGTPTETYTPTRVSTSTPTMTYTPGPSSTMGPDTPTATLEPNTPMPSMTPTMPANTPTNTETPAIDPSPTPTESVQETETPTPVVATQTYTPAQNTDTPTPDLSEPTLTLTPTLVEPSFTPTEEVPTPFGSPTSTPEPSITPTGTPPTMTPTRIPSIPEDRIQVWVDMDRNMPGIQNVMEVGSGWLLQGRILARSSDLRSEHILILNMNMELTPGQNALGENNLVEGDGATGRTTTFDSGWFETGSSVSGVNLSRDPALISHSIFGLAMEGFLSDRLIPLYHFNLRMGDSPSEEMDLNIKTNDPNLDKFISLTGEEVLWDSENIDLFGAKIYIEIGRPTPLPTLTPTPTRSADFNLNGVVDFQDLLTLRRALTHQ